MKTRTDAEGVDPGSTVSVTVDDLSGKEPRRLASFSEPGSEGVLLQEMVSEGEEVIVGFSDDPQFGPVVLFGLGGIFVEVMRDVALRVAPLTRRDVACTCERRRTAMYQRAPRSVRAPRPG